jgi:glycosyltransferase involved in cell wall biosynthesis
MKIKITGREGHPVYGKGGMQGKLEYGFKQLGHDIVEEGEELLIVPGTSADLSKIQTNAKKIWWSHGVNWARGFENEDLTEFKNNYDNCDAIAYQSRFARHMVCKAFGEKKGPIIWNASIPMLPMTFPALGENEEIKMIACSIWRAWKRLHEIERLIRLMATKGHKINLKVIGKDPRDECPYQLPKSGENYTIEYLGLKNIEEMRPLYHESHVGTHLAFNDYSPASVTEMMACGLPVIVTNSGGSKDIVQHAGIILKTDPSTDVSMNIHREDALPTVDDQKFEEGFLQITNNLADYQQKNKKWVEEQANCIKSAERLLNL